MIDWMEAAKHRADAAGMNPASTSGLGHAPASETRTRAPNMCEMLDAAATLARQKRKKEEETGTPAGADMALIDAGRLLTALYETERRGWDKETFEMERTQWELLADEFEAEKFKCSLRSIRCGRTRAPRTHTRAHLVVRHQSRVSASWLTG